MEAPSKIPAIIIEILQIFEALFRGAYHSIPMKQLIQSYQFWN